MNINFCTEMMLNYYQPSIKELINQQHDVTLLPYLGLAD